MILNIAAPISGVPYVWTFALILAIYSGCSGQAGPQPSPTQFTKGSTDYYIAANGSDGNDCTSASPCKTINSVNSRLGASLPLGASGTTIHVAPGIYRIGCSGCGGAIITDKSGSSNARIRFISDTRWAAQIVTTGGSSSWNNRGSYVDIVGFDITGDGPFGIENNSSSFSRMLGNHLHNIHLNGSCTAGAGIVTATTTSDEDVIGNWVHDVGDLSISCNQVHGIYIAGPRGSVVNNITDRVMGWGIHLWHAASNIVVVNNTSSANGQGGILIGCGDSGCVVNDNDVVNNNLVIDNDGFGIIEHGVTGTHNSYNNNLAFHNATGSFSLQKSLSCAHCPTTDPQLSYQADGNRDYRLTAGSPAKDAGTSAFAPSIDLAGGARPVNGAWDIGAYEYGSKPGTWPWY